MRAESRCGWKIRVLMLARTRIGSYYTQARHKKGQAATRGDGLPKVSLTRQLFLSIHPKAKDAAWRLGPQAYPAAAPDRKTKPGSYRLPVYKMDNQRVAFPITSLVRRRASYSGLPDASQMQAPANSSRQPPPRHIFPDARLWVEPTPARRLPPHAVRRQNRRKVHWTYLVSVDASVFALLRREVEPGASSRAASSPACTGDLMQPGELQSRQGTCCPKTASLPEGNCDQLTDRRARSQANAASSYTQLIEMLIHTSGRRRSPARPIPLYVPLRLWAEKPDREARLFSDATAGRLARWPTPTPAA